MNKKEDSVNFWENKYIHHNTGWDLNGPTPVFDNISKSIKKGKVCILGCGRGYDAVMFAERGFPVTAVDFAPSAVKALNNLANKKPENLTVLQQVACDSKRRSVRHGIFLFEDPSVWTVVANCCVSGRDSERNIYNSLSK